MCIKRTCFRLETGSFYNIYFKISSRAKPGKPKIPQVKHVTGLIPILRPNGIQIKLTMSSASPPSTLFKMNFQTKRNGPVKSQADRTMATKTEMKIKISCIGRFPRFLFIGLAFVHIYDLCTLIMPGRIIKF